MDNLNDILASLTPDDIRALKETADAVFGSSDNNNHNNEQASNNPFNSDFSNFINPDMFSKIASVMGAMSSDSGKRCKLIEALKPNLSYQRQKKADEAMQIIRLLEILPLISNLTNKGD